jgi:hypothetical protein
MPNNLPYPGYSWPFTQHAIALRPKTLYGFLTCASSFAGRVNPGNRISSLMINHGLLTANVRGGVAQPWRDYQQVLAELGMIYSTRVERNLRLTSAAKTFLAGEVGFSELMTIQALRYQYPNGQKSDIQARLKSELRSSRIGIPDTLMELHVLKGILIKPGLLILRILLELYKFNGSNNITINECLMFLLPLKTNQEWLVAFSELRSYRQMGRVVPPSNRHARRNLQDWFKFLGKTELFNSHRDNLILADLSDASMEALSDYCEEAEKPESFWIPDNFENLDRVKWFDYLGNIPFEEQTVLPKHDLDENYIKENYIDGVSEDEDLINEEGGRESEVPGINLHDVSETQTNYGGFIADANAALENLRKGHIKRAAKTAIHDSIVKDLAKKLTDGGARVFEDRDSVDLLAIWPENKEAIFEVKTISRRNFQPRLRLAIGQLKEYGYRRLVSNGTDPEKIIVINTPIPENTWQINFLNDYLKIGLMCKNEQGYSGYIQESSLTEAIVETLC